jgi:hypothetical protein
MKRNSPATESEQNEVRFQLSLLNLLYPSGASERQVTELEGLLNLPVVLAPR